MRTTLAVAVAITAVTLTACSGGGEDGLGTGDTYSVLGALGQLPGPAEPGLMIQTGDLTAATEAAGLARPQSAEPDAVIAWIGPLMGMPLQDSEPSPAFVPMAEAFNVDWLAQHEEFDAALGWSLVEVDSFAETLLPPDGLVVVAGDFDEETLAALPEVTEGVVTHGAGDDFSVDLTQRSAASPLGRPVRQAQQDGLLAVSPSTPTVEEWLTGPERTLADDTALAGVAAALDEHDVLSAILVSGGDFAGSQILGQLREPALRPGHGATLLESLPAVGFDTVGIGWAVTDGASVITVAYHLGTESAAAQSVPDFESLYQDGVSLQTGRPLGEVVELVSVEARGEVLVVQVRPTEAAGARWILDQLHRRDVPFVHA